jgi:hypothetical protein
MKSTALCGLFALPMALVVAACGLKTPDKDPFTSDEINAYNGTRQASYENDIVDHVTCEIAQALALAQRRQVSWLDDWGTTVTLSMTMEDQTGLSPGISTIQPLQNVVFPFPVGGNFVSPQSFSLNFGGTASVNALRTETIQFTFRNNVARGYNRCNGSRPGVLIDGDLKLRQFIYDKAVIASLGNTLGTATQPMFNTWTEEITFVASYGGSFAPTWKLARLSTGAGSNLLVTQRTNTNDLIITLGPIDEKESKKPHQALQLIASAMSQHNARVAAAAIAVSVTGQTH